MTAHLYLNRATLHALSAVLWGSYATYVALSIIAWVCAATAACWPRKKER